MPALPALTRHDLPRRMRAGAAGRPDRLEHPQPDLREASDRHAGAAIAERGHDTGAVGLRDRTYRYALAVADVLAVSVALLAATLLAGAQPAPALALTLPFVVLAAKAQGLYDRDELLIRKTTMDEAPQLFQLATLTALVVWIGDDLTERDAFGAPQVVVLWATLFALALLGRRAARAVAGAVSPGERILFIGDAGAYARLRHKLEAAGVRAALVGRMSLQRDGAGRATRGARGAPARVAHEQDLRELIGWADVHRIVIEPQTLPPGDMLDLVRSAKAAGVRVSLLPRVLDVVGTSVVFDDLHGMTLLGVRRFGLTRSSRALKRVFDLVGATLGLVAVAPLLALIAVAIRLDSRGPVLFRQTRVGRDGRHFRICKFRTMCTDAEQRKAELRAHNQAQGGLFKIVGDPRITRVGRLLRKTSLDELPQLLNVVAGDMSLVGPRPLICDEDELITGWDRRRLQLTPGMTGHWQILGSTRVPMHEMVKIDYLYVAGWSLWTDVKILARTIPYVLARRAA